MNFCQEFYAEDAELDPYSYYIHLNKLSPAPFSVFYRTDGNYLISSSPERYLRKTGNRIISQPIKGTAPRHPDPAKDKASKQKLESDPKERAENVMIVDLVRNDLSRTAAKGSVKVEELCGIYSFSQVHQMISTVTSTLDSRFDFVDLLSTTFPMGSMTGAPKIRAMELIEDYEETKRGLYSGAVGYITPDGDFDFNVVIRSVLYNSKTKYLSFITGGAITSGSTAEREYNECLLKAKAITESLK
jgi:para-aminobenzoate synthetase component 1